MADHDIDIELILALAEGRLPPEEAAAAEAGLDADGRRELEAQRAALAALSGMEAARLTDAERSVLRSSVREAIHLPAAAHQPAASIRPPWLSRLFPALAGAAVLVLVAGIGLSLGGGGGRDESAADLAGAETAADTADGAQRAADEAAGALQSAEAPAETTMAASVAAATAAGTEEAASVQAESATDAAGGEPFDVVASPDEFRFLPVGDIQRNPDQLVDAMLRFEQDALVGVLPLADIPLWAERVAAQCWEEALVAVPDATGLRLAGFGEWGNEGAEFYEVVGDIDFVIVATLRDTCEVVALVAS